MTVSLAERARQGRLIALQAIKVQKSGADIVMLSNRGEAPRPVFTSRRTETAATVLLAA